MVDLGTKRPGGKHATLHDQLDAARLAYQTARDGNASDDLIWQAFESYTALITEVDRRDPTFYQGRKA